MLQGQQVLQGQLGQQETQGLEYFFGGQKLLYRLILVRQGQERERQKILFHLFSPLSMLLSIAHSQLRLA